MIPVRPRPARARNLIPVGGGGDVVDAWVASMATPPIWWATMGDASGTTMAARYGNAGTYTAPSLGASSLVGTGTSVDLAYDGGSHYATIANASAPVVTSAMSVVIYINLRAYIPSGQSPIIRHQESFKGFYLQISSAGVLDFTLNPGSGVTLTAAISTGPHVLVGTCDGTNAKIYIDRSLSASGAFSSAIGVPVSSNLVIGEFETPNPTFFQFNGQMQHGMIFDYALNSTQIAALP